MKSGAQKLRPCERDKACVRPDGHDGACGDPVGDLKPSRPVAWGDSLDAIDEWWHDEVSEGRVRPDDVCEVRGDLVIAWVERLRALRAELATARSRLEAAERERAAARERAVELLEALARGDVPAPWEARAELERGRR